MQQLPSLSELFFGLMGGSAGESAAAALILGGLYLLIKKIITWHIPVSIIGTVVIFTTLLKLIHPDLYAGPAFHLLSYNFV